MKIGKLDQEERARQKQASRNRDQARLAAGEIDSEGLRKENGFFSSLDLKGFRIAAIGGKPLKQRG